MSLNRFVAALLCSGLSFTVGGVGFAQSRGVDVEATVSTGFIYDTNIPRLSEDAALLRELTLEDYAFDLSGELSATRYIGQVFTEYYGSIDTRTYSENTRFDRTEWTLGSRARRSVGICVVRAAADFSHRQTPLEDLSINASLVDNVENRLNGELGTRCIPDVGLGYTGRIEGFSVRNDLRSREVNDADQLGLEAGLAYSQPSIGVFFLEGRYVDLDYINRGPTDGGQGFELASLGLRYLRDTGSRVSVEAGINAANVSTPDRTEEFNDLLYDARVEYRNGDLTMLRASVSRDVSYVNRVGSSYAITDVYDLSYNLNISDKTKLALNGRWLERDFRTANDAVFTTASDEEQMRTRASLGYDFLHADLTLFVEYRDRQSENPDLTYDAVGGGVGLTYKF